MAAPMILWENTRCVELALKESFQLHTARAEQ